MKTNSISLLRQSVYLLIFILIISAITFLNMKKFCPLEKLPLNYYQVPPSSIINKQSLDSSKAKKVKVGISVNDFPVFSPQENSFTVSGMIWFLGEDIKNYVEKLSRFSFDLANVDYKSEAILVTLENSNQDIVSFNFKASFKSNLNHKRFPFQDHIINLVFINDAVFPDEIKFESSNDDFVFDKDFHISGWKLIDKSVNNGFGVFAASSDSSVAYPEIVFSMSFYNNGIRPIILVILPLIVIFLLEMFNFCLDQNPNRALFIGVSGGNFTLLLSYRFIIENIVPKVGYTMISDFIFYLFLLVTFLNFIISSLGPTFTLRQRLLFNFSLQAFVIISFFSILNFIGS